MRLGPKDARFCPFCGCDKIVRDMYDAEHRPNRPDHKIEFICEVCNRGFRIDRSAREISALMLFGDHRKLRQGKT